MYVGIDVGGTNLKAGLVDEAGHILAVERRPLEFQSSEQLAAVFADMAKAVARQGGARDLAWVGMGLPGAVDGGTVRYTANLPMENVPLEALFRQQLDVPLLLGNDADCAAVGEYVCGAGKGCRDLAVITLGTGVGCGIILDGKLHGGEASSEAGHMVIRGNGVRCNCGRRGCWEQYASATALIRLTKAAMAAHPESALRQIAADGPIEGRTAFLAAEQGDPTALDVCRRYVRYLADGLINLVNLLRPEVVAIGGGVSAAPAPLLLEPLQALVERESYAHHGGRVTRVVQAKLGNDAGIVGAALLGRVL